LRCHIVFVQIVSAMASTTRTAALALVGLLLLAAGSTVSAWKRGRATFYGNEPWYWSIHHGSEWHVVEHQQEQLP
jgi:hypothetical protein